MHEEPLTRISGFKIKLPTAKISKSIHSVERCRSGCVKLALDWAPPIECRVLKLGTGS